VKFDELDNFEKELRQALRAAARPSQPSNERSCNGAAEKRRAASQFLPPSGSGSQPVWLAAALGGAVQWQLRQAQNGAKGEEARRCATTAPLSINAPNQSKRTVCGA